MRRNSSRGFTLIEVLVTIAIFAVTVGLLGLVVSSLVTQRKSAGTVDANQAIQSYLDGVTASWRSKDPTTNSYLNYANAELTVPTALAGYQWTLTLSRVDPSTGTPANVEVFSQAGSGSTGTLGTTADATAPLKRVRLVYTAASSKQGTTLSSTLEVARP